jgi:hypothetical protein
MVDPAHYDITIHQGATFELPVQYKDASGVPVDLSGYTASGTIWNRTGTTKLANFEIPWTAQASGMFNLRVSADVTSGITEQGQYDILFTEPSGDRFYLLEGTVFLNPGLTVRG